MCCNYVRRFWPALWSSLPGDKFVYNNRLTDQQETHHRMQAGIANTPVVINVSVGYSFALRRQINDIQIKAIVFKTYCLKETMDFFEKQPGIKIEGKFLNLILF